MKTLEASGEKTMQGDMFSKDQTSSMGASPAKTYQWQGIVRDWLEKGVDSGMSSIASLASLLPHGALSKMSLACFPLTKEKILPSYSGAWKSWGSVHNGECWTADFLVSPNEGVESSLSDILETDPHPKYFLSAKACKGIKRRAKDRGKEIPKSLEEALDRRIASDPSE
tara:strand:- start:27 stop:533 length:507 start_codon:yes stop_codon:yes gene_type:complete